MADLATDAIKNVFGALNCAGIQDLDSYWSITQIYEFVDEEMKRLTRSAAVWVDRQPVAFDASEGFRPCPAGHLATRMADVNGLVLRNKTVQQLQALDPDWYNSQHPVTSFVIGVDGADTIRLYGVPSAALVANLIFELEAELTNSLVIRPGPRQTVTPFSPLLDDVFCLRAIAECRRAETDAQMPESVAFCEQLIGIYHQAAKQYFGGGL